MDNLPLSFEVKNFIKTYIEQEHVNLKIVRSRKRKLGDFRYNFKTKTHLITINSNLSELLFLITFLHELAHKRCNEVFGRRVKPHGNEWKLAFQQLLSEARSLNFSDGDKNLLDTHINAPRACHQLEMEKVDDSQMRVKDLNNLQEFKLLNSNKIFIRLEKMRLRYRCQEKNTLKYYSVSANAVVTELKE